MGIGSYLGIYGIAAVTFLVIDLVWIGIVANKLYEHYIGDLMRESPNVPAAAAFYLLFLVGLVYFAIGPALNGGTLTDAVVKGALFGLFTYATWDLTNLAVIKGFPAALAPIDMAWGTFLSGSISTVTYLVWDKLVR